jgi:phosphoribosylformimino-5-aminoimidazole carboxamide ribotide isomerase
MRIIPAIDIIDGKCVRLSQGDYGQKKVYNENPLEVAQEFEDAGLKYLHLVDLDGAKSGAVKNWDVVELIKSKTNLEVDFGGGIKTADEVTRLLQVGVRQVNLGSVAVKNRPLVFEWLQKFGSEKIILSADVLNKQVKISGWMEDSVYTIDQLITDYLPHDLKYVTCTDISKDGMLAGTNFELYRDLRSKFPTLKIIASGGVSSMGDVVELGNIGVEGVIIGKAIYENRITVDELSDFANGNR